MIINETTFRTPSVLTKNEIKTLKSYIEGEIRNFLKGGIDNFVVKDIFGYDNWDWCKLKLPVEVIYEN